MQHGGCQSKAFVLRPALGIAVRHRGAEPSLILRGSKKRADHSAIISRLAIVQHIKPELIASLIWITTQVSEVFSQDKRGVVLSLPKHWIVGDETEYAGATLSARGPTIVSAEKSNALGAEIDCGRLLDILEQKIDECLA